MVYFPVNRSLISMKLDDVFRIALKHFPMCHVIEDMEGEVVIFTGMICDENHELREITREDID